MAISYAFSSLFFDMADIHGDCIQISVIFSWTLGWGRAVDEVNCKEQSTITTEYDTVELIYYHFKSAMGLGVIW